MLGLNSGGQPWLTWATGPNGLKAYGSPRNSAPTETPTEQMEMSPQFLEPAAVYNRSALNAVEDVPVMGIGPGTDALQGSLDSTAIFKILRDQL
jgi:alkaline phosphatase